MPKSNNNYTTVKELIKSLSEYPDDTIVSIQIGNTKDQQEKNLTYFNFRTIKTNWKVAEFPTSKIILLINNL